MLRVRSILVLVLTFYAHTAAVAKEPPKTEDPFKTKAVLLVVPVGKPIGRTPQEFKDLADDTTEAMSFGLEATHKIQFDAKEQADTQIAQYVGTGSKNPGDCIFNPECLRERRTKYSLTWLIIVRLAHVPDVENGSRYRFKVLNIGATTDGDVLIDGESSDNVSTLINEIKQSTATSIASATALRETVPVTITTNVAGAQIEVNGKPTTLQDGVARVRPGTITIRASKDGYMPAQDSIACASDEKCKLALALVPTVRVPVVVKKPESHDTKPPGTTPQSSTPLLIAGWSSAGVGATSLIIGLVLRSKALSTSDEITQACANTPCAISYEDAAAKHESASTYAVAADWLIWGGAAITVAGIATAITGHLLKPHPATKATTNVTPVTWQWEPIITPTSVGIEGALHF